MSNSSNYTKDVVVFFDGLYKIIPSKLIIRGGTYDIHLTDKNLHFLIYINYHKFLYDTPEIVVNTIIQGGIDTRRVVATIEIDLETDLWKFN